MDNIITILPIDKQGRIVLARYFKSQGIQPKHVAVRVNGKTKELIIAEPTDKDTPRCVDAKGRVFIDSSLRNRFFTQGTVYLVLDAKTNDLRLFSTDIDAD